MTNATHNEKITNIATYLALGLIVVSWATPQQYFSTANANVVLGSILVGLNVVRYFSGVAISRGSFLAGAFLLSLGVLNGADITLENPIIFPLGGMMIAAYHIANRLEGKQKSAVSKL